MDSGKQTDSVGDGSRENNVEKYIQTLYRAMKLCRPSSEELLYLSSQLFSPLLPCTFRPNETKFLSYFILFLFLRYGRSSREGKKRQSTIRISSSCLISHEKSKTIGTNALTCYPAYQIALLYSLFCQTVPRSSIDQLIIDTSFYRCSR